MKNPDPMIAGAMRQARDLRRAAKSVPEPRRSAFLAAADRYTEIANAKAKESRK